MVRVNEISESYLKLILRPNLWYTFSAGPMRGLRHSTRSRQTS